MNDFLVGAINKAILSLGLGLTMFAKEAITTLIAYLFSSITTYIVAQKCYYIKWHWETIIINMAVCLGAYGISTIDFGKLLYYKNKILKR
ncbi:hypothetical protein LL033_01365 [Clostridium estertheticum]|uniref:hypothetical protein n=1 Tax=Clostridium estertheticum TaxID=238834 RepID=UPI001C0D5CB2|nr:hypothetical protein [Clostridium estertheticum]MBU3216100.1 hypothetical protein [Clostridium estertheticum]WAG55914.1 hypothetical protein LL033_01365 [Clostridium estertheticum]